MAKSVNQVILMGRLTRDPEQRTTTTGKTIASFSIAVDRAGQDDSADFFDITAWEKLGELVRSARFFNQKAKALQVLADYFGNKHNFNIKKMKKSPLAKLREELLSLYRIGPETADSILLYALK